MASSMFRQPPLQLAQKPPKPPPRTYPHRRELLQERRLSLYHDTEGLDSSGDQDRALLPILEGHLDNLPPISSKTVRVFLSSTFSDMIQERNALMEHVYPKLKDLCREKYGLEFQVVDLRWGVREEAQDDHSIIDVCLQEIENCKTMSVGPSFVAFMGQKYGYRPFPPKIDAAEFVCLRDALAEDGKDVTLLDTWFKKEENMIPPMFVLQPISSQLAHYNDKNNARLQESHRQKWNAVFDQIQKLLRRGAQLCFHQGKLMEKAREKYFISVTEAEIAKGMLQLNNPAKHCLCFYRHIDNLSNNLCNKRATKFVDLIPGTGVIDNDAQFLLNLLKARKMETALSDSRSSQKFNITWKLPDCDPNDEKEYLSDFCQAFYEKMSRLIVRSLQNIEHLQKNYNFVEVLQHLNMCRWRSDIFQGREKVLSKVQAYLLSNAHRPLVVYGQSGSGKTSVLAKAASICRKTCKGKRPCVVIRFLGTTARSCSIRLVLGNVCWQISKVYGLNVNSIPADYAQLVMYFHEILKVATAERNLVIFLDSMDQLAPTHRAHNLSWLPLRLPEHVHVILSTLPGEYDLLDTLRTIVPRPDNFLEILPLGTNLSLNLVKDWLRQANRTLTAEQFPVVEEALRHCSLPLYTRLVFEEVCRWKSYWTPEQTTLASTVKGMINSLFDRLERAHGKMFVRNILSYITASKNGLSDMELDDLMSLDDDVLNDVYQHWVPPVRRVPPLLWPRLLNDLGSYIMKREANGIIVYYWYHRQFIAVAKERYLSDLGHKLYIHSTIAHYLIGTWGGGQRKPFRYSINQMELLGRDKRESQADRMVPPQPLVFFRDPSHPEKVTYNLRKLSELPYHLMMSKRITDLKTEVLFNYEWLHTKLSAMGLQDVLSDFRSAMEMGNHDPEIPLVGSALRVGGSYVNQNPDTLAFDLIGRLLPYYNDYMNIRNLIQQCDTKSLKHSAVVPLYQCFDAPKGMLLYILEDHTQVVFDFLFSIVTSELISVSKDGTIAFWDLATGERTRVIDISELQPGPNTRLFQSQDGKYLVCDSDALNSPVYIFDTMTGQLLHRVGKRTPTSRRVFLAGYLLCRQKNIIDIRSGQIFRTLDDFVETKQFVTCGITPNDKYILIGQETETSVFDLELGVHVARFPNNNIPCVFSFTEDSKKVYVGYTEDCAFKVFDIDPESAKYGETLVTFNYKEAFPHMKFLAGPLFSKELAEIAICKGNPNLTLLNVKRCHLILLNLITMNAKMVDGKSIKATNKTFLFGCSFSMDGRFMMAGQSQFLHIWSTENCRHLTTLTLHTVYKFPMSVCQASNLVATSSTIHTAIKVWNLDRMQSGEPSFLQKYGNPIDMVACAPDKRLIFIKHYYGLASIRGYKYHDSFGIDVWNISTGNKRTFLPFGAYGVLLQMEVSPDAQKMALLLNRREQAYLVVLNLKSNKLLWTFSHYDCKSFVMSPNWDFAATLSVDGASGYSDIFLWNTLMGLKVEEFKNASSPVFTLDNVYLLFIMDKECISVYSLKITVLVTQIMCNVDRLQAVPNNHHLVLATRLADRLDRCGTGPERGDDSPASCPPGGGEGRDAASPQGGATGSPLRSGRGGGGGSTQVSSWYFHCGRIMSRFQGIADSGILDITKDGQRVVDGLLQVFDLKSGSLICRFCDDEERTEREFVRVTFDGQYLLWVDGLSLKVGKVASGNVVARISMHERPTSLTLLEHGYIAVIGRKDGHLVTLKVLCEEDAVWLKDAPLSLHERINCLIDVPTCADGVINTFDLLYQSKPAKVKDSELPKVIDEIQSHLQEQAKVPHSVIKTPSLSDLSNLSDEDNSKRRGSANLVPANERRKSGSMLPASVTLLPAGGSPVVRRKDKAFRSRSKSTQDVQGLHGVAFQKSTSMSNLLQLASGGDRTPPRKKKEEEKKKKRKSPLGLSALSTAMHNTGSMLMALTDMGGSRSLPRMPRPKTSTPAKEKTKLDFSHCKKRHSKDDADSRGRSPSM